MLDCGESGIEGWKRVNRSWRQSVHHNGCGAFRHITTGTNGDQGWDHMTHQSQHHSVLLRTWHRYHQRFVFHAVSINQFRKRVLKYKQLALNLNEWENDKTVIDHVTLDVTFKLKQGRMCFIHLNLTKSPVLVLKKYITISAYHTYNWHLTNLHSRASKGNKIMRKLQGKWVLVPHWELKLIICDNLSASENSNMSTKLYEPQKGVEKKKRRMMKEERKKKRKGQLET